MSGKKKLRREVVALFEQFPAGLDDGYLSLAARCEEKGLEELASACRELVRGERAANAAYNNLAKLCEKVEDR